MPHPLLDTRQVQHLVDEGEEVATASQDLMGAFDLLVGLLVELWSWANPRMAFRGVRSSWLMRDRNSLLARLARSASSLA